MLDNLRAITSYFRRMGRAALMGEAARADFDRVTGVAKKKNVPAVNATDQQSAAK